MRGLRHLPVLNHLPHLLLGREPVIEGMLADKPALTSGQPVQTHNMSKLTWHQAQHLDGQYVRLSFVVNGRVSEDASRMMADA